MWGKLGMYDVSLFRRSFRVVDLILVCQFCFLLFWFLFHYTSRSFLIPSKYEKHHFDRDYFIEESFLYKKFGNVIHEIVPPKFDGIVFNLDADAAPYCEQSNAHYFVTLRDLDDPSLLKVYFRGQSGDFTTEKEQKDDQKTCVLYSRDDGRTFSRPSLGIYPKWNDGANHVTFDGKRESHNFAPFIDTADNVAHSERYKAIGGVDGFMRGDHGVFLYGSADGIHWHALEDHAVIDKKNIFYHSYHSYFDSFNSAIYDEYEGLYKIFSRANIAKNVRTFQWSVSVSGRQWSPSIPSVVDSWMGGRPGLIEQFYTTNVVKCPTAPHILLAVPMRCFDDSRQCDATLMVSRDGGRFWSRVGRWDSWYDSVTEMASLNISSDNSDLADNFFYYTSEPVHGIELSTDGKELFFLNLIHLREFVGLVRFSLPVGRFGRWISRGSVPGAIITNLITVPEKWKLYLNYETFSEGGNSGHVSVAVVSALTSEEFSGCSTDDAHPLVSESSFREEVAWGNGAHYACGSDKVRLRIVLSNAAVYGYEIQALGR